MRDFTGQLVGARDRRVARSLGLAADPDQAAGAATATASAPVPSTDDSTSVWQQAFCVLLAALACALCFLLSRTSPNQPLNLEWGSSGRVWGSANWGNVDDL